MLSSLKEISSNLVWLLFWDSFWIEGQLHEFDLMPALDDACIIKKYTLSPKHFVKHETESDDIWISNLCFFESINIFFFYFGVHLSVLRIILTETGQTRSSYEGKLF